MGTDDKIFKLRIKDILSDKNMTSKELAEKMGKAPQYVSNIINGGKGASISTLIEVAKVLNVEFRDLFATTSVSADSEVNGYVKVKGVLYEVHSFEDLEKLLKLNV
ncbi:helix-turn-helix domain-containing protein [Parabacteroides distasonis]|uniref:helix-turn-helix domain-containing protein n=1 Tax=Parabacteroides distasonis TaxID=823 RepID=UPI0035689C00